VGSAVRAQGVNLELVARWRDRLFASHEARAGPGAGVTEWGRGAGAARWARSSVWSRGFNVHRLGHRGALLEGVVAMVPVVDMLDHDPGHGAAWHTGREGAEDFAMVTRTGRRAGQALYNNYGRKSNEELVLGYGFVLPHNPRDFVHLSVGAGGGGEDGASLARRWWCAARMGLPLRFYLTRAEPLPENLVNAARVLVMPERQAAALADRLRAGGGGGGGGGGGVWGGGLGGCCDGGGGGSDGGGCGAGITTAP